MNKNTLDAEGFISQTLIWLLQIGYVAVLYMVILAIGTRRASFPHLDLMAPWWLNLIAFVVMAATFLPVYRWIRVRVRELIYSQQGNPFPAMTQLNQYLEASLSPHDIHPTIVETIARTLKLPYVAIELQPLSHNLNSQPDPLSNSPIIFGEPAKGAALERVSLLYHEKLIGELYVSPRRAGESFSPSDRSMLHDLAQQVGIALYAAQLTDDLQRARTIGHRSGGRAPPNTQRPA